jgi:hypothetical protein
MLKYLGIIMKTVILLILVLVVIGCSQTIHLKYRWDKNTEPDMSHYDLFRLVMPDSAAFWNFKLYVDGWPADTSNNVAVDSSIHYQNGHYFTTVAHIFSPVDSLMFEYDQPMEQGFLRAYICAYDSVGNASFLTPSLNAVYIGDRDSPNKPGNHLIKFK